MRKLAILKTGGTLPELAAAKRGNFEHWTLAGLGAASDDVLIIDAQGGDPLPDYADLTGVVITGSHDMVTDCHPWSERLAMWLPGLVECGIPTLGICYGHQLLAYALGGEVADNPKGREFGTITLDLAPAAASDPLLGVLAARPAPEVQVCHTQSVTRLPAGAQRLAASGRDANEAFRIGDAAWGVQFHPEFDAEVVQAYIGEYYSRLAAEGQDPETLAAGVHDTPVGDAILKRFMRIATGAGR